MLRFLTLFILYLAQTRLLDSESLRLYYFDAKGVIETARVMLKVGGVPFEDIRFSMKPKEGGGYETPEFDAAKSSGLLTSNLDRVPILVLDGGIEIGQSKAIERYVARLCKMCGDSDEEAAQIDNLTVNVRDIEDKWQKIRTVGGMAPNDEKAAAIKKWYEEGELKEWLLKLELSLPKQAACDHFAVGSRLSHADFSIWHLLRENFDNPMAVESCIGGCKRLISIADYIDSNQIVKAWLAERPQTMF